jgi:hypothetical protein
MRFLARRSSLAKAAALCTRTLESLNPYILRFEKNRPDRISAIPLSRRHILWFIRPHRMNLILTP